jgi:hypothetical protein
MILHVASILSRMVPGLSAGTLTCVARIHTTRPVYLVFLGDAEAPTFAVQFGTRDELLPVHRALVALHAAAPDLVPGSLACGPSWDGRWVLVQEGLPGDPWFRIRGRLKTIENWFALRDAAIATLRRLHQAIANQPEWRAQIDVGDELLRQIRCASEHAMLPHELLVRLRAMADAHASSASWPWFWQHGDFCVNNLVVADGKPKVIDLEEFGHTAVPLHDEFSLALSLDHFMRELPGAPPLAEQVETCIAATLAGAPGLERFARPLFAHHLLWRINQTRERPTRVAIRQELIQRLDRYVRSGTEVFAA